MVSWRLGGYYLMSDPFSLDLPGGSEPQRFDDAVREAVERLNAAVAEFEGLLAEMPDDLLSEEEWRVIELAGSDIEKSAEMAEEGYIAVAYDSHAWYRIMEHLERVSARLQSALGILREARARLQDPSRTD